MSSHGVHGVHVQSACLAFLINSGGHRNNALLFLPIPTTSLHPSSFNRKKTLKPPGRETAPRPKAKPKAVAFDEDEEIEEEEEAEAGPSGRSKGVDADDGAAARAATGGSKSSKKAAAAAPKPVPAYEVPSLRRSTLAKVEMAESMREWKEQVRHPHGDAPWLIAGWGMCIHVAGDAYRREEACNAERLRSCRRYPVTHQAAPSAALEAHAYN